ncbi:hypothetical protein [Roseateles sp. MS654]|uniref:hypothetical protein n=1 Tax=Roseateles sp. MS654 TaxID=3412685 RepID=UPI003C30325A
MNKSFKTMLAAGAVALTAGQVTTASAEQVAEVKPAVNAKFKSSLLEVSRKCSQEAQRKGPTCHSNKEWQGE